MDEYPSTETVFSTGKLEFTTQLNRVTKNAPYILGLKFLPEEFLPSIITSSIAINKDPSKPNARSWFPLVLMPRERIEAKKNGEEKESITMDAGVFQHVQNISDEAKIDQESAKENIEKALIEGNLYEGLLKTNDMNLQALYVQGYNSRILNFDKYNDRLKDENRMTWLNYISSNKIQGRSIKEWDVEINSEGKYIPVSKVRKKFEVEIVDQANWENLLTNYQHEVIEKKLVAKVILIKDKETKKISQFRILYNHVYCDEGQSQNILNKVLNTGDIKKEDLIAPEDGVEVLRRSANDKEEPIRDIEGHYKMTPGEIKLLKTARESFPLKSKMYFSVLEMLGHLAIDESSSGYICVDATGRGAGLQVSLIPEVLELNFIKSLIPKLLESSKDIVSQVLDNLDIIKRQKLFDSLKNLNTYSNEDIKHANDGWGIAAMLDTHVPESKKGALEIVARKAHEIISKGKLQHSNVRHKKDMGSALFITALSEFQDDVKGNIINGDGTYVSFRHRARTNEYEEAKKIWKSEYKKNKKEGIYISKDPKNMDIILKNFHIDRIKNIRLSTAVTSFIIAYTNIENDPKILDKDMRKKELITDANNVFEKILEWNIEKEELQVDSGTAGYTNLPPNFYK